MALGRKWGLSLRMSIIGVQRAHGLGDRRYSLEYYGIVEYNIVESSGVE